MRLFRSRSAASPVRAAMRTDVGRLSSVNQDVGLVDLERGLLAVADGMGGHPSGDVAAGVAIQQLPALLDRARGGQPWAEVGPVEPLIERALVELSEFVRARAGTAPELVGMGTTIVLALMVVGLPPARPMAYLAHVGDSRAYLLRQGELHRLTEDHSLANELIRGGVVTADQAHRHPMATRLVQAIGIPGPVRPAVRRLDLLPGDRLLLCSDGVTDLMDDALVASALAGAADPAAACHALVDTANAAGGRDNITAVVADYRPGQTTSR